MHDGPVCNARVYFCFDEFENEVLLFDVACAAFTQSSNLAGLLFIRVRYEFITIFFEDSMGESNLGERRVSAYGSIVTDNAAMEDEAGETKEV